MCSVQFKPLTGQVRLILSAGERLEGGQVGSVRDCTAGNSLSILKLFPAVQSRSDEREYNIFYLVRICY